jgi:hypothetical protein
MLWVLNFAWKEAVPRFYLEPKCDDGYWKFLLPQIGAITLWMRGVVTNHTTIKAKSSYLPQLLGAAMQMHD